MTVVATVTHYLPRRCVGGARGCVASSASHLLGLAGAYYGTTIQSKASNPPDDVSTGSSNLCVSQLIYSMMISCDDASCKLACLLTFD